MPLKITRDFVPNPDHSYTLPAGTEVQSAKFGRNQAHVWQDPDASPIWRGEPKRIVGHWPARSWRYVVEGEMSGRATSERAAKSKAERAAWESQANHRTKPMAIVDQRLVLDPEALRHQMTPQETLEEAAAFQAQLDWVRQTFPDDFDPDAKQASAPGARAPLAGFLDMDDARMLAIRPEIAAAFGVPASARVALHDDDRRPDWAVEMPWDGDETVACGSRFYARPEIDGFTLVVSDDDDPIGFASAIVSTTKTQCLEMVVDMVQVAADRRAERFGAALMAGLAELAARDGDALVAKREAPAGWHVAADTGCRAADRLVAKLEQVLDDHVEACCEKLDALDDEAEGPSL
jgi:GNAT superfamily N-acetyltransferase